MKKYLFYFVLAMALLMGASAVLAKGKPVPPGDGDGTKPPIAQPFARAPIAQPLAVAPIAQPFV